MSTWKGIRLTILGIAIIIGLYFGLGYLGVLGTKTIGKARMNAEREVFEETQSYVEGKRQEAVKLYKEYNEADSVSVKKGIESIVSLSFANFDETKLNSSKLERFVSKCKYGE